MGSPALRLLPRRSLFLIKNQRSIFLFRESGGPWHLGSEGDYTLIMQLQRERVLSVTNKRRDRRKPDETMATEHVVSENTMYSFT